MGIFGRKAKEMEQSAQRHDKLARKGRGDPVTSKDGTMSNSHAEVAKDKRHAASIYRHVDKQGK